MGRPVALVRYVAIGVGVLYTILLYVLNVRLDGIVRTLVGWMPLLATLLLVVWDLWAWRWPFLHKLTHRPRIDGFWQVTLQPTDGSHIPPGGNWGPIPGFVMISQSYWSTHVRQLTVESGSHSRACTWENRGAADVEPFSFLFENDPRPEHRSRSLRHLGACTFRPGNLSPTEMEGVYFTDRYTQGSMDLRLVDRTKGYNTYREAAAHADDVSGRAAG